MEQPSLKMYKDNFMRSRGLRYISILFSIMFFFFIYKYFTVEVPTPERSWILALFFLALSFITNLFSLKYAKRSNKYRELYLKKTKPKHRLLKAIEKQKKNKQND